MISAHEFTTYHCTTADDDLFLMVVVVAEDEVTCHCTWYFSNGSVKQACPVPAQYVRQWIDESRWVPVGDTRWWK